MHSVRGNTSISSFCFAPNLPYHQRESYKSPLSLRVWRFDERTLRICQLEKDQYFAENSLSTLYADSSVLRDSPQAQGISL